MGRITGLAFVILLGISTLVSAAGATLTIPPAIGAEYAQPHQRIDIGDGRKLNLFCMGNGRATVIFDSGGSDWSSIWALVQPGVAAHARACTYDRAGMGYSDPSSDPRSPFAIVDDLHKLIQAAKISTPVFLVGHSAGGFNMKLYAALYPEDVAGLVLVDPAEERAFARLRRVVREKYGTIIAAKSELSSSNGFIKQALRYQDCAMAARVHDLDPRSDNYKQCTDPVIPSLGPAIATERQKLQGKHTYQDTQTSEFIYGIYGDARSDDAYASLFSGTALADKPLIVLTHGIYDVKDPMGAEGFFAWNTLHEQTARLSKRGINRIVPETHHYIQIDRPQAVIDAVGEVLHEVGIK